MSQTKKIFSFPKNFLWGAATSAHQVEGNNHNDWSEWEKLGKVHHHEQSGLAAGHYQRFREDFALAKKLGHNTHRFSIEWSRVEPRPGHFDEEVIEHYRQVIAELRRLDIEPVVTLWHFTNPIWIRDLGGWTNPKTIDYFGRYVMTITRALGHSVKYWITINEPTVYTSLGYINGYWPPEEKNYFHAWQAIRYLVRAHTLAYQIIHRHFPHAKVGSANNLSAFAPSRPGNVLDRAMKSFAHFWHNQWWLDQTFLHQDFIGLNYYFYHPLRLRFASAANLFVPQNDPHLPKSDVGWDIYPEGLGIILDWLKHYRRPVIITENGLADASDQQRSMYIQSHIEQIALARERGVDVRGYIHWSLLDNFEWREGFGPRFGLVAIDYRTMHRTIRPSAVSYQHIIENYSSTPS